jgi:hypothetical protein
MSFIRLKVLHPAEHEAVEIVINTQYIRSIMPYQNTDRAFVCLGNSQFGSAFDIAYSDLLRLVGVE